MNRLKELEYTGSSCSEDKGYFVRLYLERLNKINFKSNRYQHDRIHIITYNYNLYSNLVKINRL